MASLKLGGKDLQVLPLVTKDAKAIWPALMRIRSVETSEDADKIVGYFDDATLVIFTALKRGNPDLTQEFVEENLEVWFINEALEIITQASKLGGRKPPEKSGSPGEAPGS